MRPQCKLGRWTWVGVLAATLLPTAYGQGVLPHTPLAPVAPNVVAGYGPGLPAFPRAASLAPVGPVGLLPSASAGLLPSAAVAGALSPAAATALAPSQSFGLTAAYSLTTQTMQNSSAGQALGAEMGEAAVAYQRSLDQFTKQELDNTRRVIESQMLEPQIFVRVRIIQVDRSHLTDVGSVLNYLSRNPKTAPQSYTGKPEGVSYTGNFPADFTPFGGQGLTINITTKHIDDLITAVANEFKSDLVAAPSLVAINDQKIDLFAGSYMPFVYCRATTDVQTQRVQQAVYKDVGIHIQVTPHLISRREMEQTFDLLPEGRALRARFQQDGNRECYLAERTRMIEAALATRPIVLKIGYRYGQPETQVNTIKLTQNADMTSVGTQATVQVEGNVQASQTLVRLSNGTGMVIGGIINEAASDTEAKVPVLGDLPLVGIAFSRKTKEREKTETLIFLEAAVVDPAGKATVEGFEYADRHLPGGPPPGTPHPPFSQVPLAPLEGHQDLTDTGPPTFKEDLKKAVLTGVEVFLK
ncbi:MAG: hypothetical protein JO112_14205 [Planctomycetes bacterium]|nr:hypothetical protein [Planctomycetota bacterium]